MEVFGINGDDMKFSMIKVLIKVESMNVNVYIILIFIILFF